VFNRSIIPVCDKVRPERCKAMALRGGLQTLLKTRILVVPFLGLLFFANTSVWGCWNAVPNKTCRHIKESPPAPVKRIEAVPPAQPKPCAVDEPRRFWEHVKCGEPTAYGALGTMIAAFFAAIIGLVALRINANTVRGQRVHEQIRMLLDIDQEMSRDPQLWGIFPDEGIVAPTTPDPLLPWKKKGLLFRYFNMFDIVYGFYRRKIWMWIQPWPSMDRQNWMAWRIYIKRFFDRSKDAQDLWQDDKTKGIYAKYFTKFINKIVVQKVLPRW
jgi:hypothetical protein